MGNNEKTCRLCLESLPNVFEPLDAIKLEMLKIIPIDLNIPASSKLVICKKCTETLQQCFDFKMSCLSNNDYLSTFRHADTTVKVCLQEIVLRRNSEYEVKCEEEKVCRFCFEYFDVKVLSELDLLGQDIFFKDMLGKCLPELDLTISEDPLICNDCMELLEVQFNFIIVCLDSHRALNIKHTSDIEGIEYVENVKREYDREVININIVKWEEEELNKTEFVSVDAIKQDDEFDEVSKLAYVEMDVVLRDNDSTDNATPNPHYPEASYACPECSHVTNRKDSLKLHLLTHDKSDKTALHKCQDCDFTSRWKSSLHQHALMHKDPGDIAMYRCAHCPYESKFKKHLRRHSKRHMDAEAVETFHCQHCTYKTQYSFYFKQHNRIKHDTDVPQSEKMFKCPECSYQTKYQSNFLAHKKAAHKIYRYQCDYGSCDFKSNTLYHVQNHALKHQSSEEVIMYRCDKCDFATKYKQNLKLHAELHQLRKPVKQRKPRKVKSV